VFVGRGPKLLSAALGGTLLSLLLTFLPEALELMHTRRNTAAAAAASSADGPEVNLSVENMGCVACKTTVLAALEGVPGVDAATVNLEGASATLRLAPGGDASAAVAATVQACTEAGFPASVRE
jgi:copper chaperone CopZ